MISPKRFSLVLCVALIACFTAFPAQSFPGGKGLEELQKINGKFTFAVIGDTRLGEGIYEKLLTMVMGYKPAFVINLGDVIRRPGSNPDWKRFKELSSPITVPYFLAVGNHDVVDEESERIFREQVSLPGNGLYYSFSAGNSLIVVLDSNLTGHPREISDAQLDWLSDVLKVSDKQHKFVFLHHPIYSESLYRTLAGPRKARKRLLDLLKSNQVDAVFAGHLHLYQRKVYDGLTQITSGGGGAPLIAEDEKGGFFHFILVTVEGDSASCEVIDQEGKVRDRFVLSGRK
jgi:3',5'-cyclic AMP phosphodiesterase CpdA